MFMRIVSALVGWVAISIAIADAINSNNFDQWAKHGCILIACGVNCCISAIRGYKNA